MNKTSLILISSWSFIISVQTWAQNLIPNGSFEIYDTCPSTISSFGDYQIEHCTGWHAPTYATSDYFNSCSPVVGVPNNVLGNQYAFDGEGYAGIALLLESGEPSWFEYLRSRLSTPLEANVPYRISFHVNLTDYSDYGISEIGAWVTENDTNSTMTRPLFFTIPQVYNSSGPIIDTANWTLIQGEFVANGGEEYVTIGFFTDTTSPDTLRHNSWADPNSIFAYYHVDGIEIQQVPQNIIIPNVFSPNGDGINDQFKVNQSVPGHVQIFNRWGQMLYRSEPDSLIQWNGRTNGGDEVPEGSYYYIVTTELKTYRGYVQVIR